MTELRLPSEMAELRPALGGIVAQGRERAHYFTVLLSSKHGLTIQIDHQEQHVIERTPSAGIILSADYLRIPPTGAVGGVELPPGQTNRSTLLGPQAARFNDLKLVWQVQ